MALCSAWSAPAVADITTPATKLSSKHTFRIEQKQVERADGFYGFQVALVANGQRQPLPEVLPEDSIEHVYSSHFVISPDEEWILRIRKVCSGVNAAYLYRREKPLVYVPHHQIDTALKQLFATAVPDQSLEPSDWGVVSFVAWSSDGKQLRLKLSGKDDTDTRWLVNGWEGTIDLVTGKASVDARQAAKNPATISARPRRHE